MGVKISQLPVAASVASDDYIPVLDTSESVLKRTQISHASSSTTYGPGTTSNYGHVKLRDDLTQTSYTAGEALSSHQGNVLAGDIGPLETGNTATAAHAKDSYFVWKGQFVKATAAIAIGATIASGTNVTSTNVSAVLSELNSNKAVKATYDETPALYSHAVGDIIYFEDKLYKVTLAISVGNTIAVGTNISADTGIQQDTVIYISNLPGSGSTKQESSITPSSDSVSLTTASPSATVNLTVVGDGELSATSQDTSVATVSLSGTTLTITGIATGDTTVTVSITETDNYYGTSVDITVSSEIIIPELEVGSIYTLNGTNTAASAPIKAVCVQMDSTNKTAVMQSYGFGSGTWPGEGTLNASSYSTTTGNFNISDIQLPKGTSASSLTACGVSGQSSSVHTALVDAASKYSSFDARNSYAWLGTPNSSGAYYVHSNGSVNSYEFSTINCVVAPAFNLALSNVQLDTSTNTLTAS